jgi:hypothetical protein
VSLPFFCPMRSLDEFRSLVRDARRQCRPGPVLLSALGIALRRIDPAYDPAEFGEEKLAPLLRQIEDVGRLDGDRFIFADEQDQPIEREEKIRLRSDIWRAVTDFRPVAPWQLDLADFRVRNAATDAALLTEEPHRFLPLPHADFSFQRKLALDFVADHRPELAVELDRVLDEGFTGANAVLTSAGLLDAWRTFRMRKIVAMVVEWADKHGIPIDRVRSNEERAPLRARGGQAFADRGSSDVDVRAVIHAAVDMMSTAELAQLPIPPVYLALAAARTRR